jgi:hypothetical protein
MFSIQPAVFSNNYDRVSEFSLQVLFFFVRNTKVMAAVGWRISHLKIGGSLLRFDRLYMKPVISRNEFGYNLLYMQLKQIVWSGDGFSG